VLAQTAWRVRPPPHDRLQEEQGGAVAGRRLRLGRSDSLRRPGRLSSTEVAHRLEGRRI